jgi:iron complex transport system substrate-binding protein
MAVLAAAFVLAGPVFSAPVPHRIISLSPTATEDLFAIGAGKQVIAVDDQSDFPKRAPHTTLSGFTPNAEAVIGFHPDLVVIQYDPNHLVDALTKAKIKVIVQPSAHSLADAYAQMAELGRLTGHTGEATTLVARMKARIAELVKSVPRPATPLSVYDEISPDFYSASSKSFIGQVLGLFGLRNIADAADDGSGFPKLSEEYILSANPDLIVLADIRCCGQTIPGVSARPGWNRIAAVKRHAIVRIDDSIASRWGPRVVDFVKALSIALRTVGH